MWCLDGSLRYIPVAAIWDGDKYLIERDEYFTIFEPLSLDVIAESTRSSQEIAAFAATKGKPPKYKPLPGADPRSGRWAGRAKTECGLHA